MYDKRYKQVKIRTTPELYRLIEEAALIIGSPNNMAAGLRALLATADITKVKEQVAQKHKPG